MGHNMRYITQNGTFERTQTGWDTEETGRDLIGQMMRQGDRLHGSTRCGTRGWTRVGTLQVMGCVTEHDIEIDTDWDIGQKIELNKVWDTQRDMGWDRGHDRVGTERRTWGGTQGWDVISACVVCYI